MLGMGKKKEPERKKSKSKNGSKNKNRSNSSNENREVTKLRKKLDQAYEEIDTLVEEQDLIQDEIDTFFDEIPDDSVSMLDQLADIKMMIGDLQKENDLLKTGQSIPTDITHDLEGISRFSSPTLASNTEVINQEDPYSLDSRLRKYDLKLNDHDERLDGLEIDVRSLKQQVALLTPISSQPIITPNVEAELVEADSVSTQYNNDLASIQGKIDRIKQEADRLIDRYDPEEDIIDIEVTEDDVDTFEDDTISSGSTSAAYANAFNAMDDLLFQWEMIQTL